MRAPRGALPALLCFTLGFILSPLIWFPWVSLSDGPSMSSGGGGGGGGAARRRRLLPLPLVRARAPLGDGHAAAPAAEPPPLGVAATELGPPPARHPEFRLAMVVPWLGEHFPPWFPYFLVSARRSAFLVDWLIFHEAANVSASLGRVPPELVPPNVRFVDMGPGGLAYQFGVSLARALNVTHETARLVKAFEYSFRSYKYIVTEYKPTLGVVFAEWLRGYTHWSYTDLDIVAGDLPAFIERAELTQYEVVTWSFGDHERLYMRGQYTAHRNVPHVNTIFARCEHLGAGLLRELTFKAAAHKRMSEEAQKSGKPPPRVRFISAEGCYSAAVYGTPGIRVKIANKFFADFGLEGELAVLDGQVRVCPAAHGTEGGSGAAAAAAAAAEPGALPRPARRGACALGPDADADDDAAAAAEREHSVALRGLYEPVGPLLPLALHSNCSRWVDERWRVCANLTNGGVGSDDDLLWLDGKMWRRRRRLRTPDRRYDAAAFFHFQTWKGVYKRRAMGESGHMQPPSAAAFVCSQQGIYPKPEWEAPPAAQGAPPSGGAG